MKEKKKKNLRWFGHMERMENDRIGKKVCVRESLANRLVGRPRKRWINSVNDCWKVEV